MASDDTPVKIPAASLVHGSQAPIPLSHKEHGDESLPHSAKPAAQRAAQGAAPVHHAASIDALVTQLNRHLNASGRPDQFRVDPRSGHKLIQQINPATGEVVGEFLIAEFPALARSVGVAGGVLIDSRV